MIVAWLNDVSSNIVSLQSNPFIHLLHSRTNEFIHGILISFFVSIIRS